MHKIGFSEALDSVVAGDPRYDREAYVFLRDALDYTMKQRKKQSKEELWRHVNGRELLEGVRQFAIKEFGPMVPTVFEYWRLKSCEDIGEMVFNLIHAGVFRKSDGDSKNDFKNGYSFKEAFVDPFVPAPDADEPKSPGSAKAMNIS
jgi:uncharacterized repeat protein (TIGR04138 family)